MNGNQQLIDGYLDGELGVEDEARLAIWLAAAPGHMRLFVREAHLHRQLREIMVARLFQAEAAATIRATERTNWLQSLVLIWDALRRPWLAAAACLLLAMGTGVWFFGATVGLPALAEVHGVGFSILRNGQVLPGTTGMGLKPGDVLRSPSAVSAVVRFAPEATWVRLQPDTELELTDVSRGKRFQLRAGKLEASVARQRPFHPMRLITSQAETRVVGTRFTLAATTNTTRLEVMEGKVRFTRLSDLKAVAVPAGHYAVSAAHTELVALPFTGSVLCEWWMGVKGRTKDSLSHDARFPGQPAGRAAAPGFEMTLAETNQFAARLCGYVHPSVTGEYRFWLESPPPDFSTVGYAALLLSPTEDPHDARPIAQTGSGSMVSRYVSVGSTEAPPPIPLVAGRRYYIEARILIGQGKGQLSIAWQPPGQARRTITGEFLSPWKPQ